MKNVEILFTNLYQLCQFRRSSEIRNCQMDFDRKRLKGTFPETEIQLAVHVFGAVVIDN